MQVCTNASLKQYNTFGIDVQAKYLTGFSTLQELQEILAAYNKEKKLILGGGSNILFTNNFEGIVIKNDIKGIEITREDERHIYVKANSGESWQAFVNYCLAHNFAGAENLSLIPGSVGASPMQNIGAYGVEIKDIFYELQAWDLHENTIAVFTKKDCEFGYRESIFKTRLKDRCIILNVTYRLNKVPEINTSYGAISHELEKLHIQQPTIHDIARAVINIRQSKLPDPKILGNAGSFFKNPVINLHQYQLLKTQHPGIPVFLAQNNDMVKIPAAWLIEQAGWKGFKEKNYGVHAQQALVLVNYGNAKGEDIYALSTKIINDVQQKFGIWLQREVNIIS